MIRTDKGSGGSLEFSHLAAFSQLFAFSWLAAFSQLAIFSCLADFSQLAIINRLDNLRWLATSDFSWFAVFSRLDNFSWLVTFRQLANWPIGKFWVISWLPIGWLADWPILIDWSISQLSDFRCYLAASIWEVHFGGQSLKTFGHFLRWNHKKWEWSMNVIRCVSTSFHFWKGTKELLVFITIKVTHFLQISDFNRLLLSSWKLCYVMFCLDSLLYIFQ